MTPLVMAAAGLLVAYWVLAPLWSGRGRGPGDS